MDTPEHRALIIFYEATGGDSWTRNNGWCTRAPLGDWYGVVINDNGNVVELTLPSNNLSGDIPVEIEEFNHLRRLDLSGNRLSVIDGVDEALRLFSIFERAGTVVQEIQLWGSPWIMPPKGVATRGHDAVKSFYADVKIAGESGAKVIPRRLLKVVMMGSSSAGKTSLIARIKNGEECQIASREEEARVEGIEVHRYQLENISVDIYDCTGQVDFKGMHEVFLSSQALFLLVWDITKCSDLSDKIIHDMINRHLSNLQRVPGATVILVANKCDAAINDATEIAERVENRVRSMLRVKDQGVSGQGIGGQGGNLIVGSSHVSCLTNSGIPALNEKILQQCGSSIEVPPAWDLALKVIDALRDKRCPLHNVLEHLKIPVTNEDVLEVGNGPFITKVKLSQLWHSIVRRVRHGVRGTSNEAVTFNPNSALEGALRVSEFAGHILVVENGGGIFLDFKWLSAILTPILSQDLQRRNFQSAALDLLRDDLLHDGILHWEFARYLWGTVLDHSLVSSKERLGSEIYSVLIKLGAIIPLCNPVLSTEVENFSRASQEEPRVPQKALVVMGLCETCDVELQGSLDMCTNEALEHAREVTLKWEFGAAGPPYGLVEQMIVYCHRIGVVRRKLCWRYGAIFQSHDVTKRYGQKTQLYTIIIRYETIAGTSDNDVAHFLTVRMIGRLENRKSLAALRYVASVVIMLSKDRPGATLKGSPVCPRHEKALPIVYLATPHEASFGGPLIPKAPPGARSNGCDCHHETREVLGLILKKLGVVVDINKDPFEGLWSIDLSQCNNLHEMYKIWRPYAGKTVLGLWSLVVVLFGGITAGVVEEKHALWQACLALMIFSLVGTAAASVVFYRVLRERWLQGDV